MTEKEYFEKCLEEIRGIGPVVKGSLACYQRRCGKPGCRKCASGEGHKTWLLSYYDNGRHTTCHVGPSQLEKVRAALENYKELEGALTRFGIGYIKMLKGKQE